MAASLLRYDHLWCCFCSLQVCGDAEEFFFEALVGMVMGGVGCLSSCRINRGEYPREMI